MDEYNDHNFSENVKKHLKNIVTSNFEDNEFTNIFPRDTL